MLLLSIALTITMAAQISPAERAEAELLARSGEYRQALDRFRDLVSRDPGDIEARLWIGRLQLWLSHPHEAEPVFRGVLGTSPSNVQALVGLGTTLVELDRIDEAVEVLARAEKVAPDDADVLAAQGYAQRRAGRLGLSTAYYRRAAALAPSNPDIKRGLEDTRRVAAHWVRGSYVYESFSLPVPDTNQGDITVNLRLADRWRVEGRGQVQEKFDRTESRGGGGLDWQPSSHVLFAGRALFSPDAEVLPQTDAVGQATFVTGQLAWGATVQFASFVDADIWIVSPGVTLRPGNRLALAAQYSRSFTEFPDVNTIESNSALVRVEVAVLPRLWLDAAYAYGIENFDTLSIDRLGRFEADTVSGGARIDFPSLTTLAARYEYQWRPNDVQMLRITATLTQRF